MNNKIYLAGPDVFFPNAKEIAAEKKKICAQYGFIGCFPLDNEIEESHSKEATGYQIAQSNEELMNQCDIIVANMTPFRGVSMDVGTAYEMGYMAARGRLVCGYSNAFIIDYANRVDTYRTCNLLPWDYPDWQVEDFGFSDNIMLHNAISKSDGIYVIGNTENPYDLTAFKECIKKLYKPYYDGFNAYWSDKESPYNAFSWQQKFFDDGWDRAAKHNRKSESEYDY